MAKAAPESASGRSRPTGGAEVASVHVNAERYSPPYCAPHLGNDAFRCASTRARRVADATDVFHGREVHRSMFCALTSAATWHREPGIVRALNPMAN